MSEEEIKTDQEETGDDPKIANLIAESKKYRERAQKAEKATAELQAKQEAATKAQLEEQNKYKELYEGEQTKVADLQPQAEAWSAYNTVKRQSLLEELPEDDRELYGKLDLMDLEAHVKRFLSTETSRTGTDASRAGSTSRGGKKFDNPIAVSDAYQRGEIDAATAEKLIKEFVKH